MTMPDVFWNQMVQVAKDKKKEWKIKPLQSYQDDAESLLALKTLHFDLKDDDGKGMGNSPRSAASGASSSKSTSRSASSATSGAQSATREPFAAPTNWAYCKRRSKRRAGGPNAKLNMDVLSSDAAPTKSLRRLPTAKHAGALKEEKDKPDKLLTSAS